MPYTVLPDGSIQTDDPYEAARLSAMLRGMNGKPAPAPAPTSHAAPPQPPPAASNGVHSTEDAKALKHYAELLSDEQREILVKVRNAGRCSFEEMLKIVGADNGNGIGGILAGMSKRSQRVGLDFNRILIRIIEGGQKVYVAQPLLAQWSALK
jgi:hypothetical protein